MTGEHERPGEFAGRPDIAGRHRAADERRSIAHEQRSHGPDGRVAGERPVHGGRQRWRHHDAVGLPGEIERQRGDRAAGGAGGMLQPDHALGVDRAVDLCREVPIGRRYHAGAEGDRKRGAAHLHAADAVRRASQVKGPKNRRRVGRGHAGHRVLDSGRRRHKPCRALPAERHRECAARERRRNPAHVALGVHPHIHRHRAVVAADARGCLQVGQRDHARERREPHDGPIMPAKRVAADILHALRELNPGQRLERRQRRGEAIRAEHHPLHPRRVHRPRRRLHEAHGGVDVERRGSGVEPPGRTGRHYEGLDPDVKGIAPRLLRPIGGPPHVVQLKPQPRGVLDEEVAREAARQVVLDLAARVIAKLIPHHDRTWAQTRRRDPVSAVGDDLVAGTRSPTADREAPRSLERHAMADVAAEGTAGDDGAAIDARARQQAHAIARARDACDPGTSRSAGEADAGPSESADRAGVGQGREHDVVDVRPDHETARAGGGARSIQDEPSADVHAAGLYQRDALEGQPTADVARHGDRPSGGKLEPAEPVDRGREGDVAAGLKGHAVQERHAAAERLRTTGSDHVGRHQNPVRHALALRGEAHGTRSLRHDPAGDRDAVARPRAGVDG